VSTQTIAISPGKRLIFWGLLVLFWVALVAGAAAVYQRLRPPAGVALNRAAWEANYTERHLALPRPEPREGYWGATLGKRQKDPYLGWTERELSRPGLVEVDSCGMQHAGVSSGPRLRLLIVGASTAFGTYASTADATYFSELARTLTRDLCPVEVTVLSAGGWKSVQEVRALESRGLDTAPDVVLFLDGLNDLTLGSRARDLFGERTATRDGSQWNLWYSAHDYKARVALYQRNLARARALLAARGIHAVYAVQPALFDKRPLSRLERLLDHATLVPHASKAAVQASYEAMRDVLRTLAQDPAADFIDCSYAFDGERATVFTDIAHFADPGHHLLAACLARELAPILGPRCPAGASP